MATGITPRRMIVETASEAARTLSTTAFPLTRPVLEQVAGLSGAEYVLKDPQGGLLASSRDFEGDLVELPSNVHVWQEIALGEQVRLDGQKYFHSAMQLTGRRPGNADRVLHILYPGSSYDAAWREAVVPPLIVGGIAVAVVALLATLVASHVSGRLAQLQSQVDRIASGDFQSMALPQRNDELFDLSQAVNRMAEMLAQYEERIRRNEQARTLGQISGGIAHQLRNSVTGCRMALQLHRQALSEPGDDNAGDDESLQVALNQLDLMEKFIQRFLSYRAFTQEAPHDVSLAEVVETVLPLVKANAAHVGVAIRWTSPSPSPVVAANAEALAQVVTNLLINAIEAASQVDAAQRDRSIKIEVTAEDETGARLAVFDSGDGPSESIQPRLFDPLVTDKPDGTGLGLSVACEIAQAFGGDLHWERAAGRTCFYVVFEQYKLDSMDKSQKESTRVDPRTASELALPARPKD